MNCHKPKSIKNSQYAPFRAFTKYFSAHNKNTKRTYLRCVTLEHQHVSIAVAIIIRVTLKDIRNKKCKIYK